MQIPGSFTSPHAMCLFFLFVSVHHSITHSCIVRQMAAASNSGSGSQWLITNLPADDAKTLAAAFEAQGIKSESDLLLLTKDDLVEMKVSIGVRNRFLDAKSKSKSGGVPAAPIVTAPAGQVSVCTTAKSSDYLSSPF